MYLPLENSTTRIAIIEGLNEKSADTGTMLHEEWKNMYPQSTFNARNIKSRLTVYLKTMGDNAGSPAKRRKIVSHSESTAIKTTTTSQNPSLANSKEVLGNEADFNKVEVLHLRRGVPCFNLKCYSVDPN